VLVLTDLGPTQPELKHGAHDHTQEEAPNVDVVVGADLY
jgi:hypothetical protein